MANISIPEEVIEEVTAALNMAIGLAMHKAPDCVAQLSAASCRLDDAVNNALVES